MRALVLNSRGRGGGKPCLRRQSFKGIRRWMDGDALAVHGELPRHLHLFISPSSQFSYFCGLSAGC